MKRADVPTSSSTFWLTRPVTGILFALAAVVYIALLFWGLRNHWRQRDFSQWYTSGLVLRSGTNQLYNLELNPIARGLGMQEATPDDEGVNYPPTAVLAFEQLTRFGPKTAYRLFQSLELVSLALVLWLLVWIGKDSETLSFWAKLSLSALVIFFYPVSEQMHNSEINIMLLALLLWMIRALQRQRDSQSACALALAVSLKVFPIILLLYLTLWTKWRTLAGFVAISCFLALLTVASVGLHNSVAYIGRLQHLNTSQNGPFSLKAFVLHVSKYTLGSRLAGVKRWLYVSTATVVELTAVLLAICGTLRAAHDSSGEEASFGLWLVTMVLLSPTAWAHYGVFFLPTLVQLARRYLCGTGPPIAVWCGIGTYLCCNLVGLLFVLAINGSTLPLIGQSGYHFASILRVYALFFPVGLLAFATAYCACLDA